MVERILVPFKGSGAGIGELSWGQRAQWGGIQANDGLVRSAGGTMKLAEGTTTEQIVTLLGFIMNRHQSLRTLFVVDETGTPRQQVHESGEITLEVHDTAEGDDPAELAEKVRQDYENQGWSFSSGWPVRPAVIRHNGKPEHFVALYAHFVIDAYGFDALAADLANLDYATGAHLAPPPGMQPMEQAEQQRSASARRQHDISVRYWDRHLRSVPLRQFGFTDQPQSPRWWEASFNSPAGYQALRILTQRIGTHSSAVLLAAYAATLFKISGVSTSVMRMLVSNRYRPGLSTCVGPVSQAGLCVIDADGCAFDELVRRAFRSQLAAGRHAYYNPFELWELIDRIGEERGGKPELRTYYDDRRRLGAQDVVGDDPLWTPQQVRQALPDGRMRWGKRHDMPGAIVFIDVNQAPGELDYTVKVDTQRITPHQLEEFLLSYQEILVEAASAMA